MGIVFIIILIFLSTELMCAGIVCSKSFIKLPKIEISQDLQGLGVEPVKKKA